MPHGEVKTIKQYMLDIPISRITEDDDGQHFVEGWIQTEERATDGLIIKTSAVEAAAAEYFETGPTLREMHTNPVGVVTNSSSFNSKGTFIKARVVDDAAWEKIKGEVYRNFSIAGVIEELNDEGEVTRFRWTDSSLVDRPADKGAKITAWRLDDSTKNESEGGLNMAKDKKEEKVEEKTERKEETKVEEKTSQVDEVLQRLDSMKSEILEAVDSKIADAVERKEDTKTEDKTEEKVERKDEDPTISRLDKVIDALAAIGESQKETDERLKRVEETKIEPKSKATHVIERFFEDRASKEESNVTEAKTLVKRYDELVELRDKDPRAYEEGTGTKKATEIFGQLSRLGINSEAKMEEVRNK